MYTRKPELTNTVISTNRDTMSLNLTMSSPLTCLIDIDGPHLGMGRRRYDNHGHRYMSTMHALIIEIFQMRCRLNLGSEQYKVATPNPKICSSVH
jgi:hypothetical protein